MSINKLQHALSAAALVLIAGPALAVDYVQCNAMRVALDREMADFMAERTRRHQAGMKNVLQSCGLSPINGAPTSQVEAYEACKKPVYEIGVREWDKQNNQLDPKTGKATGSRFAMNMVRIHADMVKNNCPTP